MKTAQMLIAAAAVLGSPAIAVSASAQTAVFALQDLGNFAGYSTINSGQVFTGTGFVGVYNNNNFAHLFGLEGQYSKTTAQVNISSLLGATIKSATLSYNILNNYNTSGQVTITGSGGTGSLGYSFFAPTINYGTATGSTYATNTANVTDLVATAAASGNNWLNLFFDDSVASNWTFTTPDFGGNADSAHVRLNVDYTVAGAVPEPATWAMMIVGMGAIGFAMRRRKNVTTRVQFA